MSNIVRIPINGTNGGETTLPASATPRGWKSIHIGKRIYKLVPTAGYVTQTSAGAAHNHDFVVGLPFRLISFSMEHTDNANAASTVALTWSLNKYETSQLPLADPLVSYTSSTATYFKEIFGEGYEMDKGQMRLTTNTATDTDRLHIVVYIQLLE